MAEILTESFCERCGTRYTFESPARRSSPLGALGTVGRGLRNFVVSPDQSIDEAFAVARAENEQKSTAHQLEAFHQTFNFCLSCRQYTCATCWNPVEGRCQSCAPMPEAEMLPAAEVGADAPVVAEAMAIARAAAVPVIELPPSTELIGLETATEPEPEAVAEPELAAEPEPEAIAEPEPEVEPALEPEPLVPLEATEEPMVEAAEEVEPFTSLAVEDLDIASPQLEPESEAMPEAEAQRALAPEPEHETLLAVDATGAEPEPAAVAADEPATAPAPEPSAPATPRPPSVMPTLPPGVSLDDEIAAYDLRVAALAEPAIAALAGPAVATPAPESLRPAAMQAPAPPPIHQAVQPPVAAQSAIIEEPARALPPIYVPGPVPDLPAASPVAQPASLTTGSCASCGLTLSATARFCRRCGTSQHLD